MAGGEHQEKPIRLFYSYSHCDDELRKQLEDHPSGAALERADRRAARPQHRRGRGVGERDGPQLTSADIILLLVSASFIASKYCWSIEKKKALEGSEPEMKRRGTMADWVGKAAWLLQPLIEAIADHGRQFG